MALPISGQVGVQQLGDGSTGQTLRQNRQGDLAVSELHARYLEQGRYGAIYGGANQAAQAVSVALATAYTGLLLYNPINSGVILVPNKVKAALAAAPAAIAPIGLISGFQGTTAPTGLTAVPVRSSQIGNSKTGAGLLYSAATIAAPVWAKMLYDGFTAAALPAPAPPVDLEGVIQILPGGFLAIGAVTAISMFGSIFWEEIPQ